jgi:hypothetical protein
MAATSGRQWVQLLSKQRGQSSYADKLADTAAKPIKIGNGSNWPSACYLALIIA